MQEEKEKKVLIPQAEREARFEARKAELFDRFLKAENLSVEILNATKEKPQETEVILKVGVEAREKRKKIVQQVIDDMRNFCVKSGMWSVFEAEFFEVLAVSANKFDIPKQEKEWLATLDKYLLEKGDYLSDRLIDKSVHLLSPAQTVIKELAESVKRRMKQAAQMTAQKKVADKVVKAVVAELKK